ncbi:hypothetical protein CISIN_1g044769mg, partial [Citrus sinensis]
FVFSTSKYVHFDTPEKPDSVIRFFINHDFSKTHILAVIRRRPQFLLTSTERTYAPKFVGSISGLSSPDLAKVLYAKPSVLHRSLHKQIIPSFKFFKGLLKFDESTNMECHSHINLFLCTRPSIFVLISELFRENVEKLKGMRFDPKEIKFGLAVFGLSEEEIFKAFLKNLLCMESSEDKIMAIMDYFVRKMGCKALFVAECPSLTTFSLEKKRIVPRAQLLKKLFLKRFVNHYKEEASQLLKLYDEKLMLGNYAL